MTTPHRVLAAALLAALCGTAAGRGVSPYLPLGIDPQIERQIERVMILADQPVMKRPLAVAVVWDALPKASLVDPLLCARVSKYLERYMHESGVTYASYAAAAESGPGGTLIIPNQHGEPEDSRYEVAVQGYVQPSDFVLLSVGGISYQNRTTPSGSMLSMGWDFAQLDVGYRDHMWSSMTDSAMVISAEAPTMPSVTLSNYRPFGRIGLQYELFVARMSYTSRIELTNGELTAGYPKFGGLQLAIEPISGWSMAFQRIMVWGGGAAGGQSLSEIMRAFFNPSQAQTTGVGSPIGKQEGGYSSSFIFPGPVPFEVYFEYAGNDTVHGANYLLGKPDLATGVHFPHLGPFDVTVEVQGWQPTWYVHHYTSVQTGYGDGITNYYLSTGNWFGDQRAFGDAVGGQAQMLRVDYEPGFGGMFELQARRLVNESFYGLSRYHHLNMGSLSYAYPWRGFAVGGQVDVGQDVFGGHFTRLQGFLRYGEALRAAGAGPDAFSGERAEGSELFVEAGATANDVKRNITSTSCCQTSPTEVGAHVGFGGWRQATEHQDLGFEIEDDDIQGLQLYSVRALDWRYRFGTPLALNLFLGASRYALNTPAYGLYFGGGLIWRDAVPKWDVSLEYRYGDKVSRLRTQPTDPQGGYRPDSYYDVSMVTLAIARKF